MFGRRRTGTVSPRDALVQSAEHWHDLARSDDPILTDGGTHCAEVMRLGPFAAGPGEETSAIPIIAAYLLAASLPCSATTPSEPILRFTGLAAVAIGRAGGEPAQHREIGDWFRRVRGRIRGSVFVPRDVELAFAGRPEALQHLVEPSGFSKVRKLLDAAVAEARAWAALKLVDVDPRYETEGAAVRQRRALQLSGEIRRLVWRPEDLLSIRRVDDLLGAHRSGGA